MINKTQRLYTQRSLNRAINKAKREVAAKIRDVAFQDGVKHGHNIGVAACIAKLTLLKSE